MNHPVHIDLRVDLPQDFAGPSARTHRMLKHVPCDPATIAHVLMEFVQDVMEQLPPVGDVGIDPPGELPEPQVVEGGAVYPGEEVE